MADVNPELSTMLTLSTAHITPETADLLSDDDQTALTELSVYEKTTPGGENYGYYIYVTDFKSLNRNKIPADLMACLDYAEKYNANTLCLDCDGPETDQLPSYTELWQNQP